MSYNIVLTENFKAEAKNLTKKYRSLKAELETWGQKNFLLEPVVKPLCKKNIF
jgi:hypothetical protein